MCGWALRRFRCSNCSQVLPHEAGAHPGISEQFFILTFADAPGKGTVFLKRLTSDLYPEKRSDVQHYRIMYEHLQANAQGPDSTRQLITQTARATLREVRPGLEERVPFGVGELPADQGRLVHREPAGRRRGGVRVGVTTSPPPGRAPATVPTHRWPFVDLAAQHLHPGQDRTDVVAVRVAEGCLRRVSAEEAVSVAAPVRADKPPVRGSPAPTGQGVRQMTSARRASMAAATLG